MSEDLTSEMEAFEAAIAFIHAPENDQKTATQLVQEMNDQGIDFGKAHRNALRRMGKLKSK